LRLGRPDVSAHYFPAAAVSLAHEGAVLFFPTSGAVPVGAVFDRVRPHKTHDLADDVELALVRGGVRLVQSQHASFREVLALHGGLRGWQCVFSHVTAEVFAEALRALDVEVFEGEVLLAGVDTSRVWHTRLADATPLVASRRLAHADIVSAAAFHPELPRLLTGTVGGRLAQWDLSGDGPAVARELATSEGQSIADRIAAGAKPPAYVRKNPTRYVYQDGKYLKRGRGTPVDQVVYGADGTACVRRSGELLLFEGETGTKVAHWRCRGLGHVDFTPDASHVLTVDDFDGVKMWSRQDGCPVWETPSEYHCASYHMAVRADGARVAVDTGGEVALLRPGSGYLARVPLGADIERLSFLGDRLVAAVARGEVVLVDLDADTRTCILPPEDFGQRSPLAAEFAVHGDLLAIRYFGEDPSEDAAVVVWDVRQGRAAGAVALLDGQQSSFGALAFDPEGTTLAVTEDTAAVCYVVPG
jgi:WD40 repeat protein